MHWWSVVDYCKSVLAGVSDTLLRWLQFVLNAAARLVFLTRKSEHITPLLCELHWLRVPERITFRLCSGFPMSSWYSAMVPPRDLASDNQPRFLQSSALCCHVDTDHSSYAMTDPGRPCVSSCGCPCLELTAIFCQRSTVTGSLSTTTEDSTFQDILWQGC